MKKYKDGDNTDNSDVGFKIILKYQGKEYKCEGFGWFDEAWGYWVSAYEFDGVRTCEHDYAALLPSDLTKDKDFGCEEKDIEVIDYWFYDKKTGKKLNI